MHPDRVVVGADPGDEEAGAAVAALYAPLGGELVQTDVTSAEMIKLGSNAFLAAKISFINEIANVCEEVGADVRDVARGVGLDDRIGPKFLQAGLGWGGSCFSKDVSALKQLAANSGYHFQLLNAVIEVNELQKRRVIKKLTSHVGSLAGKRVALLGLSFKPNTDDMRGATSLVLAARLEGEGAIVRAYDPVAMGRAAEEMPKVEMCDSALAALDGADAAVLVTEWPEFAELDWGEAAKRMARPLLVDGRNFLDAGPCAAPGSNTRGSAARSSVAGQPRIERIVQAIVLVGGEGTRLRPLTSTVPKPALTLVDRPFLAYMVEWLAPPRRRGGRPRLRLPARCAARGAGRGRALGDPRSATSSSPSRWARPARSASPPTSSARSSASASSLSTATCSPTSTSTPCSPPTRQRGARATSACTRSRTPPPTAWSAAAPTARCSSSSRRPARRRRGRSTPACTRSSARSST